MNAALSGAVFVNAIAGETKSWICLLLGGLAGALYTLAQRIVLRYPIVNGELAIIFGVMAIGQGLTLGIFSTKNGLICCNN